MRPINLDYFLLPILLALETIAVKSAETTYDNITFAGKMAVSPLRRRTGLIGALIVIPLIVLLLASSPDMTSENALAERLADLQARLQQMDSLHRARREEVQVS